MLPLSARCPITIYICTKFQENISKGFRVIERTRTEIFIGALFHKHVGGVTVLVLCTLSDYALCLSQA